MRFHHVGVGTPAFEAAIEVYRALGYEAETVVDDPGLQVRIALMRQAGSPLVEIVAPLGPEGPLQALLARKQLPSPYHTCYAVPDVEAGRAGLRARGFQPVGEIRPAVAFGGARIAYHYHVAIGLLELVELPDP